MSEPPLPPPPPQWGAYPGNYPPPPPQPYSGYAPPPTSPKNGLGTAALVLAIIALFSGLGGIVLGPVAIVLGFLGRGRAKRGEATNGGIAIAGIVLGFLSIIEAAVVVGLIVWFVEKSGGSDYVDCVSKAGQDGAAIQKCVDQFRDRVENQFSVTLTPTP
jgi:hypothetical protein